MSGWGTKHGEEIQKKKKRQNLLYGTVRLSKKREMVEQKENSK